MGRGAAAMWTYFQIGVVVVLVAAQLLGLWMAVDVAMKGRTAQGAVAWALALVFLPIVALPFYLVFGDRKFEGYVRARRAGTRGIDRIAKELNEKLRPLCPPLREAHLAYTAPERLAKFPFSTGNRADLLIDGKATFDAILGAIESARDYLLVQFYIIRDDGLGQRFQKALLRARERGVRVYLLYDEIGSYFLPASWLKALTDAGCVCSGFRTKRRRQKPFRLNFRNHRKIVVADGRSAFVGGLNVGDEYLGLGPLGRWRDTHIAVRGAAVQCIQLAFVEDWYWVNQKVPELDWEPRPEPEADVRVLVVPSSPADELETCGLLYTHLASVARKRLWIATPYFVPDEQILGALQLAALRGVDVRVIIPEGTDNRLVWHSAWSYYDEVLPVGVKLYRYQPGFMHQKVTLCDELTVVGTANLDNRSFRINFEITVVVADSEFAEGARAMLEDDLTRCVAVKREDFDSRPFLFRLTCKVARLLAPIQ